ncbi:VF530 family DNA-binding protein [Vibrio ostreicida]|uniref:VF530 family DNA-binding protein n=1 Tax=Vibrio ostreicida TaxID=526588 RepID=A0ABT8C1V7_9VIBR|nr:VF530 family DNA-binding protein [Vibrio ostreicida]MDN3611131.1 VF530 family DNA-binding protein [Vibrio ostreicida]MDN3611260.1 VF530 family DNA-binding protein [Vibrio ostreicida]MDN3612591.1 VF530 family DNA-binding protein [Vibrio ostreicida]
MTDEERIELQQNNPLHGLKLDTLLQELVDFYGWDILDTAMRFNCFHTNPSVASSVKYLKKTDWAREKLENFYLYRFKRMPRASSEEFDLSPRARTFPHGLKPKEPMVLTVDSILASQAKAASAHKERSRRR